MLYSKIIVANKFFFRYGGVESYFFALMDLLAARGHTVAPFAMHHPQNQPTPWSRFFVSQVDYDNPSAQSRLRAAARSIYSLEARRKIKLLIEAFHPGLAHIQHIYHQISPSILDELAAHGIPIVQTIHDYKPVCPTYKLFVPQRQENCYRCRGGRFYNAIVQNCSARGPAVSMLAGLEAYLQQVTKTYKKRVACFICPSRFLRDRLVESGIGLEQTEVIPQMIDFEQYTPVYEGSYALFIGRLEPEKGAHVFIEAARRLPAVDFKIVGSGSAEPALRRLSAGLDNVAFLGKLEPPQLKAVLAQALCVVVPSIWHDIAPLVIAEAAAAGKAVIASDLGGIPEMVVNGQTGYLVPPRLAPAIAAQVAHLHGDSHAAQELGRAARRYAEVNYSAQVHYNHLMQVYGRTTRS